MSIDSDRKLTIFGHIAEFRSRLLKSVIALAAGIVIALIFADRIFYVLTLPAQGHQLIYIDMTEMFGVYMQVCLAAGIFLAMPYLVYQLIMFVAPALSSREKRYVYLILPWIALMFVGGVAFSYFVLVPPAVRFLLTFGTGIASPQIRIGSYITVVTRVMLATGCIFQLPVITTFLARLGIVSYRWLAGKRKWAFVLAFVLGAIITPTFDPVNQSLVAAPLIVLYEMSIWLARLVQKKRASRAASAPVSA
jgi:sec-independent protein translocase protein TatC